MKHICILIALLFALSLSAQAQFTTPSCYSQDIQAPAVQRQTVMIIDLTTPKSTVAVRDIRAAALASARDNGQRFVVLTFAGIAPGETLGRELDLTIESPITDEEVINNSRIGPFKRSQACVKERLRKAPEQVLATLDRLLQGPTQPLPRSEIVYALRQSIADFAQPGMTTRFLIYSDGLQNGSGMSFYKAGAARQIDAGAENRTLQRLGQAQPQSETVGLYRVLWWGLLTHEPETGKHAPTRYLNADALSQLSRFWANTFSSWGAKDTTIGPTLNNPDLHYLPLPGPTKP